MQLGAEDYIQHLLETEIPELRGSFKDDFFALNPDFLLVPEFKSLTTKVVSSSKRTQSNLAWYVVYHYRDSLAVMGMDKTERLQQLQKALDLTDKQVNNEYVAKAIRKYKRLYVPRPLRYLYSVRDKIDTLADIIDDSSATSMDDISKHHKAIREFDDLRQVCDARIEEYIEHVKETKKRVTTKDGRVLSASATGALWDEKKDVESG